MDDTQRQWLQFWRYIAKSRGGACLSRTFVHRKVKLAWRCALGHEWTTTADAVDRGHWCPTCAARARHWQARAKKVAAVLLIAKKHGGRCLADDYVDQEARMRWRCAEGHEWEMNAMSIGQGFWCRKCGRSAAAKRWLDRLRGVAKRRGGDCLSTEYVKMGTRMQWLCAKGHRWWATPNHVRGGTWCPRCYASSRGRGSERG